MGRKKGILRFIDSKNDEVNTTELKNHIGEMQSWMRNLEQHLMSLNARLGAVEQRISTSASDDHVEKYSETNVSMKHSSVKVMNELTQNQLHRVNTEIQNLSKQYKYLCEQHSIICSIQKQNGKQLNSLRKQKTNHTMTMKLGKKEIPVELSGMIGGCICFLVAGLAMMGATELILSPWFLTGIGFLLIGGTFLRTEYSVSLLKKIRKLLVSQSNKSTVRHSDSSP